MNMIEILKQKESLLPNEIWNRMKVLVTDLSSTEQLLHSAIDKKDKQLLEDVIARLNRIWEGTIKEAYMLFSGKSKDDLKISDIEKYFQDNRVLQPHVLSMLDSYRNWRNRFTHDYTLRHTEDEVLLAFSLVSALVNLIFGRMIEKIRANQAMPEDFIEKVNLVAKLIHDEEYSRFDTLAYEILQSISNDTLTKSIDEKIESASAKSNDWYDSILLDDVHFVMGFLNVQRELFAHSGIDNFIVPYIIHLLTEYRKWTIDDDLIRSYSGAKITSQIKLLLNPKNDINLRKLFSVILIVVNAAGTSIYTSITDAGCAIGVLLGYAGLLHSD